MSSNFEIADLLAVVLVQVGSYYKIKGRSLGWGLSLIAITYFLIRILFCGFYAQSIGHLVSWCFALRGLILWKRRENRIAGDSFK